MLIAQITDPHIVEAGRLFKGRVDTAAWLARAVAALNAFRPAIDAVILTGDCVDEGKPAQYDNLAEILAPLHAPLFAIPGNHDRRADFLACFPAMAQRKGNFPFVQYAVDDFPVRLVALDSLDEGKPGGLLCAQRLDWLGAELARAPERPTLVFLHHPPFACGIRGSDVQRLAEPERLEAIVRRHANVERVAVGHLHRAIEKRFAGTIAASAPATAHQVGLSLDDGAPFGFTLEQPGFRLFRFVAHEGMTSHLATHAPFEGPFSWDDGTPLARAKT